MVTNCQNEHVPAEYSDHRLLCVELLLTRDDIGPGSWRFNNTLLHNDDFRDLLDGVVRLFFSATTESTRVTATPKSTWEALKRAIKETSETFSRGHKKYVNRKLTQLQISHQDALQQVSQGSTSHLRLVNEIEKLLDESIHSTTQQYFLRSATRWHEQGERNNKYFYKVIKQRQAQQTIQSIRTLDTGDLITSTSGILREARTFYSSLYTPTPIDDGAMKLLLQAIPVSVRLTEAQCSSMDTPPTLEEIMSVIAYAPKDKSPGLDGLPFEIYQYLLPKFPEVRSLFLVVLHQAFTGDIPLTWKQTRMVLLYKKGDPVYLSNWRPLSLINSDAKIFTKILANRFNRVLPGLINPYQTGFMPSRYISDNGWVNQVLMANHRANVGSAESSASVAVLLDQEKAYDRVHPDYLCEVLQRFGFPATIVQTLRSLFFDTSISLSINGFLGKSFTQRRGLRQGDPLSPLLFNLAFEPFLRCILASPLTGVSLLPVSVPPTKLAHPTYYRHPHTGSFDHPIDDSAPPIFKLLSYADDLEVFLSSPQEWPTLQTLLEIYSLASNAKVNLHKTEVVSLSGSPSPEWQDIATVANINYHTRDSPTAVRYLGYPLFSSDTQLKSFLTNIKLKIQQQCNILMARGLSVRGSSLVANSLILSRLWHLLRVTTVPDCWLRDIRNIVRNFVLPFFPAPSWAQVVQPKRNGGLGIIDPEKQQYALQMIFIQRVIKSNKSATDFVTPLLGYCLKKYTGHHSFVPWLQHPQHFLSLLKPVLPMWSLTKLLVKLPPLQTSHTWSGRWVVDTPLRCALIPLVPVSESYPIAQIPLRYLVSDVIQWSYFYNTLTNLWMTNMPKPGKPKQIYQLLEAPNPTIAWLPIIKHFIKAILPRLPISTTGTPPPQVSPFLTSWAPDCRHWQIDIVRYKKAPIQVSQITPGQLRKHWIQQEQFCGAALGSQRPPSVICIPYKLPHGYHHPKIWKIFWSLPLHQKAITPWWRLLKDSIGAQEKLFHWNPQFWTSPLCTLCKSTAETAQHFFVSCEHKWPVWNACITEFSLSSRFSTPLDVWNACISLCDIYGKPLDDDVLLSFGCVLDTIWRYHWYCIFNNTGWSFSAVLNRFHSSIPYRLLTTQSDTE